LCGFALSKIRGLTEAALQGIRTDVFGISAPTAP